MLFVFGLNGLFFSRGPAEGASRITDSVIFSLKKPAARAAGFLFYKRAPFLWLTYFDPPIKNFKGQFKGLFQIVFIGIDDLFAIFP